MQTGNQRSQALLNRLNFEQAWERNKDTFSLVHPVRFREHITQLGLTTSPKWPQWERDWQKEERAWKNLLRSERLNMMAEFQKRDRELTFPTVDAVNAEKQWRQTREQELNHKLLPIYTQKQQSLNAGLDRLAATEKLRIQNQEDGKIVQYFAEAAENVVTDYLETLAKEEAVKQYTDQRGLDTKFKYDTKGNVIERTIIGDITGDGISNTATTKFAYNENNLLTSVIDPLGNEVTAFYEDSNNPKLPTRIERRAQGQVLFDIRNTYYAENANIKLRGLLQKQQIAAGTPDEAIVEYTYNEQGLLTSQRRITGNSDPDVVTLQLSFRMKKFSNSLVSSAPKGPSDDKSRLERSED